MIDVLNGLLNGEGAEVDVGLLTNSYQNAFMTSMVVRFMDFLSGTISNFMNLMNDLFFNYQGLVGPFAIAHGVAGTAAAVALVIVLLKNGIQNLMNMAGSGDYVSPAQIIMDVIKASGLACFLPWLVALITSIMPPVFKFILGSGFVHIGGNAWMGFLKPEERQYVEGGWDNWLVSQFNPAWWAVIAFIQLLVIISIVCFFASMCKFQVEMMFMDLFAIIAAVDSVSSKKNIYETWVQSFQAILITQVSNILFFALMINRYLALANSANNVMSINMLLVVGCGCCLIKGTVFTNKFKNGGLIGGGVGAVANVARTAMFMMPR